jgi:hypothetical protein
VADDAVTASCPAGDVAIIGGYNWIRGDGIIASSWRSTTGPAGKSRSVYVSCEPGTEALDALRTTALGIWRALAQITVYVSCEPSREKCRQVAGHRRSVSPAWVLVSM